jgi:hypothetical protein
MDPILTFYITGLSMMIVFAIAMIIIIKKQ